MILYFKYKKFIKIFKYIKKRGNTERLDWILEEKYGADAEEALSLLMAKGGLTKHFMSSFYEPHSAKWMRSFWCMKINAALCSGVS